jgi:hypothetical protein
VCFDFCHNFLDLYKTFEDLPHFLAPNPIVIIMSSSDQPPAKPKSLCDRSSYIRKCEGTITEKEYFHNVFRHLTSVKHKGDDSEREELKELDPLGYSINRWIVRHQHTPVDGTSQYPALNDQLLANNTRLLALRRCIRYISQWNSRNSQNCAREDTKKVPWRCAQMISSPSATRKKRGSANMAAR